MEGEHVGREGRRRDKQVGKMLGLRGITKEMMPGLGGGRRRKRVLGQGNKSGLEVRHVAEGGEWRSRCGTAQVEQ